jgi:hypothetical protein
MESYELLRKAAAGLPRSKSLLRNIMRDSVRRLADAKKQKRQQDAGATVRGRNGIQGLLYARSNNLSRKMRPGIHRRLAMPFSPICSEI